MKKILLVAFIIFGVAIGFYFRQEIDLLLIKQYILDSGWLGPLIFILIYIVFTVLMLPGALLTILGGAIFGLWGIAINLCAAVLGASTAFIIARYISNDWVRDHILKEADVSHNSKLRNNMRSLMVAVDNNGWQIIALLRLIPAVPFNLLNYILGLTTISFGVYILTSAVFMIPGTIAYTYLGVLGDIALQGEVYSFFKGIIIVLSIFIGLYILIRLIKSWRAEDIKKLHLDE